MYIFNLLRVIVKEGSAMKKITSLLISAATAAAVISTAAMPASADYMLKGDVNIDSSISLRDATMAQKIQLGTLSPSADQKTAADINGNGTVEVADAYLIQRLACYDDELVNYGTNDASIQTFSNAKKQRIKFYEAVNADRAAKGLSSLEYNDAMLAAGQELAEQFATEAASGKTSFSGKRYNSIKSFTTIIEDYKLPTCSTGSPASPMAITSGKLKGDKLYEEIKKDVENNGTKSTYYNLYNNVLMGAKVKVIYAGACPASSSTAHWIIGGYS